MVNFVYLCAGIILAVIFYFLFRKRASYNLLGLDEVPVGMIPIDRELLMEIVREAESMLLRPEAHDTRRRLRFKLDSIQDQFQRMLRNAERPKHGAQYQWRIIIENKLEYPPEVSDLTTQLVEAEREMSRLIFWQLCRIWLWRVSGFHKREWGPVPDLQKIPIEKALAAYDRVRSAAIEVIRCYGEGAIAEDLAAVM